MSHAPRADRLLIKPAAGARPAPPRTCGRFIPKARTKRPVTRRVTHDAATTRLASDPDRPTRRVLPSLEPAIRCQAMRRPITLVVACLALLGAGQVAVASGATSRLKVPALVATALHRAGFPARTQCGGVIDVGQARPVPGCWLVIEWRHYSVHVIPHSSRQAARAVYKSTYNRWARKRRMALVRNLVLYGFRVPGSDWQTIRALVIAATQ